MIIGRVVAAQNLQLCKNTDRPRRKRGEEI